jgi:broad specificity phosphatase PhoE
VSDLHCPATLLVARHGEAEYEQPHLLTDEGGRLTPAGAAQVEALAVSLQHRRVARVYSSRLARAVQSARLAAERLGVDAVPVDGLEEFSVGSLAGRPHDDPELASAYRAWMHGDPEPRIPGGANGEEVLDDYREALQSIADQHRGETVLVFSHGGVMAFALPRLTGTVRQDLAERHHLPSCQVAEVVVDGDGFGVTSWPGVGRRDAV